MKKILLTLLGVLIGLPIWARDFQYTYEGQTITYTVLDEVAKTCETKAGNDHEAGNTVTGDLILPAIAMDGEIPYSLTRIGDYSFGEGRGIHSYNYEGLTSIIIPQSVKEIGRYILFHDGCDISFSSCHLYAHLSSLTIPASVETIEADAFRDIHISTVIFEDWDNWYHNVTLGNIYSNPYQNVDCHRDYYTKEVLASQIFAKDIQITTPPVWEEGTTEIRDYVGAGLPTFRNEVKLPSTLKRIGAYTFLDNKELYHVFMPEGLEEIGESAFADCELLENPKFPSSIRKIEDNAFRNCSSITEIELPNELNQLGNGVFQNCEKLEKAALLANIDNLGDALFKACFSLNKVYLPLNLKSIGDYTFYSCKSLDEISFPSTLESIGDYAFSTGWIDHIMYWGSLTKVTIPNNVTSIGKGAFSKNQISHLTLGNGLACIPEEAFSDNPLDVIDFSEGLEMIEPNAFALIEGYWPGIAKIKLPSTVKKIGESAFQKRAILDLEIPDGVTSLPKGSCGIPTTLKIGKDVQEIDPEAFLFDNLITLRIKADIPPTLKAAFQVTDEQNDQLTLIVNQKRMSYYKVDARWKQLKYIIEEQSTDVVVHLDSKYSLAEEIRIQSGLMPSQVTKMKVVGPISEEDLIVIKKNMISLRSLDLSEVTNLPSIPDYQFTGSLLTELIFPQGIERIGDYAFYDCQLLKMSELPETIKYIGEHAFTNCISVTISRLPQPLENLGEGAFSNCIGIQEISFGDNIEYIGDSVFSGCKLLGRVDFSATSITFIPGVAFSECTELDEILLPESVTVIGGSAFKGTAFRDLSFLSDNVLDIGYAAFSNCRRLVNATLPNKMTSVSSNLFANCPRLLTISMPAGITEVGSNFVLNNKKLSNISSAAQNAPIAEEGAFDNIRIRYVSLTVPTLSFRSYLRALEWGKFESIQNQITSSINKGVIVTHVAEDVYQDMLKEDRLEELSLKAQQQEAKNEVESHMLFTRAVRRSEAQSNISRSFATLFDGAQIQTGTDCSATRIFLTPENGVNVTSVLFNGEEMIDKLEDNSLLLPEGSNGTLEIRTDYVEPAVLVKSISLSKTTLSIKEGEAEQLELTITPEDADDKSIKWESSNPEVATVSEDGLVEAIAEGKATITVTTLDGSDLSATCEVTVVKPVILVETIELTETAITLVEKQTAQLTATIAPENADDKSIKWESSNPEVATVSDDGLVEAIAEGKATITVTTLDGSDLSASCEVTVTKISGILTVSVDGVSVRTEGANIIVTGVAAGESVAVYTLSGVLCNTAVSDGSEIRIEAVAGNYYIVKAGKTAVKVRL